MAKKLFVDSIALQIEILSKTTNKLSSKLYILFDTGSNKYIIRGCNYTEPNSELNDSIMNVCDEYSFECHDKMTLFEFICLVISDKYSTISLINYKRMYINSKLITYKYLDRITGIDRNRCELSSKTYENITDILRHLSIINDFTNKY